MHVSAVKIELIKAYLLKNSYRILLAALCVLTSFYAAEGQTITGAWRGKVKNTRLELKLVRSGDSIAGTSYYYDSKNNFTRYSVKGYFDPFTNQVIWWDEALLVDRATGIFVKSHTTDALLLTAEFNCPGDDKMLLDGSASLRDDSKTRKGTLHLEKMQSPVFTDEWDFVIENYTVGANDPYIIDSISRIAFTENTEEVKEPLEIPEASPRRENIDFREPVKVAPPMSVNEKFVIRKKTLATVIPVTGDSIELRFYDNAEIDGDSIALFMNGTLMFKNIRLTDRPYILRLANSELQDDNELVMVAENLGSIPPNTSLMVAIVGDKRYEARLQSTENSSALIRLIRQSTGGN